jgi:hypothetical protein
MRYSGRDFTDTEFDWIRELISDRPEISHKDLSVLFCQKANWQLCAAAHNGKKLETPEVWGNWETRMVRWRLRVFGSTPSAETFVTSYPGPHNEGQEDRNQC